MEIKLQKKGKRNQLICVRDDGSFERSELGPNIPYHDLAHYASEKILGIGDGFFGNIRSGLSVEQLGEKNVIKKLGADILISEVVARTLQLLSSAACTKVEFPHLVRQEMDLYGMKKLTVELSRSNINRMLKLYDNLLAEWESLPDGEMIRLEF